MNDTILKYTIAIILFTAVISCSTRGYMISGKISGEDSAKVFLSERINHVWEDLDSAIVKNGEFKFKGNADSAKITYLRFKTRAGRKYAQPFILENGDIQATADTNFNIIITGTEQNNILAKYNAKQLELTFQSNEITKKHSKNGAIEITQAVKDSILNEIDAKGIAKKAHQISLDYAEKYVNTPVGALIFTNYFYALSTTEKEALFSKMNAATKAIPRVAELIAATEVEKQTSAGAPYVNFTMNNQNETPVSVASMIGKTDYLLIDFWASWCPSCIEEMPELKAFYDKNHGKKFDIAGVSFDSKKENWVAAIEKFKLQWTQLSDLKGWDNEGGKLYAIKSIPATILIDKNGKIVGRDLTLTEIQKILK